MENLIFAATAVAPLFGVMAVGYVLSRSGFFSGCMLADFNRFVFRIALPCLLFVQAYQTDFSAGNGLKLPLFGAITAVALVAVLWALVPRVVTNPRRASAIIQGVYRTNIALFGLPLAINLFGEGNTGDMVLMVAFMVPLFNVIAVVLLSSFAGGVVKPSWNSILKDILKNRLIWGVLLGLCVTLAGIKLPTIILKPISDLGATATPLSMLCLGGTFSFRSASGNRRALFWSCILRLVAVPAAAVALGLAVGFRGPAIGAIFIVFGAPTAASSYIMAQSMGSDGDLAGEIVVFTTMMSVFSIFIGIVALRGFGII
ncbi:MAG TPA: AEC family transporter [Candidatus Acidoferrum sp.]|nr:AEC family transporter [Candidatus Acidoferrum sp.]